ncbi:hypothetical protein BD413DRAFT_257633 [Trametes elegans]|nr:hypothetical protein BD413DRAFT_257633 [Trametes elegans]
MTESTPTAAAPDTTIAYPDTPSAFKEDIKRSDAYEKESSHSTDNTYVTFSDLRNTDTPAGWTMHVHPRGSMYWTSPLHKTVIDDDIRKPHMLERATQFCNSCVEFALPEGTEAQMIGGMDASFCLFVNHDQCVAGYDHTKVRNEAVRDLSPNGLLRARRIYWGYMAHHPSHRACPREGYNEAINALRSYQHEHILYSARCIAPFSKAECVELLEVLHRIKDAEHGLPATTALLGWILQDVYSFRTADRYAQVTRDELRSFRKALSAPPDFAPRQSQLTQSALLFLIRVPFFGIPQTYLAHVKSASEFRGHMAGLKENWEAYTVQLVREYSDFILIATVLLSATVGLLTIDDIGEASRVAAMLSAFASLGSMTVGVFFVWRHQRNARMPSSFTYLHNARNNALGLSGHALLLSIPPVLLVWSIIAFAAAALAYTLQDTTQASTWVIFALFVIMLVAVTAGVYTFSTIWHWQSRDAWWRGWLSLGRADEKPDSSV